MKSTFFSTYVTFPCYYKLLLGVKERVKSPDKKKKIFFSEVQSDRVFYTYPFSLEKGAIINALSCDWVVSHFMFALKKIIITITITITIEIHNYSTRFETRTKEFNWEASRRVSKALLLFDIESRLSESKILYESTIRMQYQLMMDVT